MNLTKSKNASHFRSSSPGSQGHVHRQQSFEAEHMNKLKLLLRNLLKCLAAWPYSRFHLLSSLVSSLAHREKNMATAADLSASHSQRTSPATAARKASQKPKMKAGNPKKRPKKRVLVLFRLFSSSGTPCSSAIAGSTAKLNGHRHLVSCFSVLRTDKSTMRLQGSE